MTIWYYVADFFAGFLLCNCIPHLTCGLRGEPFPTPFARPPGFGLSSALVNFLWGSGNLLVGAWLFYRYPVSPGFDPAFIVFAAGFLLSGIWLALHFEAVRSKREKP